MKSLFESFKSDEITDLGKINGGLDINGASQSGKNSYLDFIDDDGVQHCDYLVG